jgi:ribosome-associated translation inhibitor RaiA
MLKIKFKNLEPSELARNAVNDRFQSLIEKFPLLKNSVIQITLEMQNSPLNAGADLFSIDAYITNGKYAGLKLKKSDSNLYKALAELSDHMLERINRAGDKERVKDRSYARRISKKQVTR